MKHQMVAHHCKRKNVSHQDKGIGKRCPGGSSNLGGTGQNKAKIRDNKVRTQIVYTPA